MLYAEGPNYRFELLDGVAHCRVWRRPDLDSNEGARCAEELGKHVRALAAGSSRVARALVFDVRDAPAVSGPRTLGALGDLMLCWEQAERRIAVVVGAAPIQALQFRRLVAQNAPRFGATFTDVETAAKWAADTTARKPPRR